MSARSIVQNQCGLYTYYQAGFPFFTEQLGIFPYGVLLMVTTAQEEQIGLPCACLDSLQHTDRGSIESEKELAS